jgi:flagellar hook-basal body complex protein FliE
MPLPISSLPAVTGITGTSAVTLAHRAGKAGEFAGVLQGAIQTIEQTHGEAAQAVQNLLNGDEELHTVALATQRAELAFDLGLQVRNKVVSAYQEIMRMQM